MMTGNDRSDIGQAGIQFIGDTSGAAEGNTVMNMIDASCPNPTDCGFSVIRYWCLLNRTWKLSATLSAREMWGSLQGQEAVSQRTESVFRENSVFDTDVFDGISVSGENSLVKDNVSPTVRELG